MVVGDFVHKDGDKSSVYVIIPTDKAGFFDLMFLWSYDLNYPANIDKLEIIAKNNCFYSELFLATFHKVDFDRQTFRIYVARNVFRHILHRLTILRNVVRRIKANPVHDFNAKNIPVEIYNMKVLLNKMKYLG